MGPKLGASLEIPRCGTGARRFLARGRTGRRALQSCPDVSCGARLRAEELPGEQPSPSPASAGPVCSSFLSAPLPAPGKEEATGRVGLGRALTWLWFFHWGLLPAQQQRKMLWAVQMQRVPL